MAPSPGTAAARAFLTCPWHSAASTRCLRRLGPRHRTLAYTPSTAGAGARGLDRADAPRDLERRSEDGTGTGWGPLAPRRSRIRARQRQIHPALIEEHQPLDLTELGVACPRFA